MSLLSIDKCVLMHWESIFIISSLRIGKDYSLTEVYTSHISCCVDGKDEATSWSIG